jgi:hypothetical protein
MVLCLFLALRHPPRLRSVQPTRIFLGTRQAMDKDSKNFSRGTEDCSRPVLI